MAPTPLCPGCQQKVPIRENLTCVLCKCRYDLECAGVSKDHYIKVMTLEHRKSWKCQTCVCKIPKTDNSDTPVRSARDPEYTQYPITPIEGINITMRKTIMNPSEATPCSDSLSFIGDTQQTQESIEIFKDTQTQVSMQSLSELIVLRLKENNKSIIEELQTTIQTEIKKAITEITQDFELKISDLTMKNNDRKLEIEKINIKLENLCVENEALKKEIRDLSIHSSQPLHAPEINHKKIVLYGLAEYYREPQNELYNRLIELFRDIANMDLSGYIEDMNRVGRKGSKNRPLIIELLSKSMTKYILNNSQCFKGTGLFVSEFLDATARKERAQLREELLKARKNGLYAVIRNNKLYIDGKPTKPTYTKDTQSKTQEINLSYQGNDILPMRNIDQSCRTSITNETENYTFRK